MKKNLLITVLLFILLSACASPAPVVTGSPVATEPVVMPTDTSVPLTEVNVCYSAPTTTQSVPWYAFEKGIFEKYGLKVNLIQLQGSSKAMSALVSGNASICQMSGNSVINAAAAGLDAVMIAGIYNTYPAVLVARPEIKTVEDLRGKTIGMGLTASASEVATRLALQELGLQAGVDVNVIEIGEEPDRVAAFRAGQIDAILTTAPYLHQLRAEGVSELFDFGKVGLPYAHTSILTTRKFIEENRPMVVNFMKAIIESISLMKADPEGTKEVIAKYLGLDPVADAADLTDAYDNIVQPLLQEVPYPNLDGLQTLITFTVESNPDAAKITPDQLVDLSILKELEDSGFIAEILKK
ncbi:MAG: ABC transporter substrate-binding protein [Chloroflexi bacterium]|nr:ABC transporter substrate-binding protein [Chloroflexota bacterium]